MMKLTTAPNGRSYSHFTVQDVNLARFCYNDFQGIDESLVKANIVIFGAKESMHWEEARELLLAPALEKCEFSDKGLKRQPGHSTEAKTKLRKRYQHLEHGGWLYQGENGQVIVKPLRPRIDDRDKVIKYESQPGNGVQLIVPRRPGRETWGKVRNSGTQIVVCEGVKDVLAWNSAGATAVGVTGITCWGTAAEGLRDHWAPFRKKRRKWVAAFDCDEKDSTRRIVGEQAQLLASYLHKSQGRWVLTKHDQTRDAADILQAHGPEALLATLEQAKAPVSKNLQHRPGQMLLAEDVDVNSFQNVVACGRIGSGKTTCVAKVIAALAQKVCSITHRVSLSYRLAESLGVTNLNDLDRIDGVWHQTEGKAFDEKRLALCVDSLLKINVSDFVGCTLIVDEVMQVLAHLATSSTIQDRRLLITKKFRQLVSVADRIVLLDAHADEKLIALAFPGVEFTWLDSRKRLNPYAVTHIDTTNKGAVVGLIGELVAAGKRVLVATDSRAIGDLIKETHKDDCALIAAERAGEMGANEIVDGDWCRRYKVVCHTPRISSGVSIEHDAFDAIVGMFTGSFDAATIEQALGRNRRPVPRYLWVSDCERALPCNGLTDPDGIRQWMETSTKESVRLYKQGIAACTRESFDDNDYILGIYALITANHNRSSRTVSHDITEFLRLAGHSDAYTSLDLSPEETEAWADTAKGIKAKQAAAAAQADLIGNDCVQQIKARPTITQNEEAQLARYRADRVLPGVSKADDIEWALEHESQARALRQLFNPESAEQELAATKDNAPQDISQALKRQKAREVIGLKEMASLALSGATWDASTPEVRKIGQMVRQYRADVERMLGIKTKEKDTDYTVTNKLLKQIGIVGTSKAGRLGKFRVLQTSEIKLLQWSIRYQRITAWVDRRDDKNNYGSGSRPNEATTDIQRQLAV